MDIKLEFNLDQCSKKNIPPKTQKLNIDEVVTAGKNLGTEKLSGCNPMR